MFIEKNTLGVVWFTVINLRIEDNLRSSSILPYFVEVNFSFYVLALTELSVTFYQLKLISLIRCRQLYFGILPIFSLVQFCFISMIKGQDSQLEEK